MELSRGTLQLWSEALHSMIFQVHLLLVLLYLQYFYHVESTCIYEWAYHQHSVVNESTNKMIYVQTWQRAIINPQFYSDNLRYIWHMIVELLDCLWHCICWPMIILMIFYDRTPHILRS
jgi:hypothetical protein